MQIDDQTYKKQRKIRRDLGLFMEEINSKMPGRKKKVRRVNRRAKEMYKGDKLKQLEVK